MYYNIYETVEYLSQLVNYGNAKDIYVCNGNWHFLADLYINYPTNTIKVNMDECTHQKYHGGPVLKTTKSVYDVYPLVEYLSVNTRDAEVKHIRTLKVLIPTFIPALCNRFYQPWGDWSVYNFKPYIDVILYRIDREYKIMGKK